MNIGDRIKQRRIELGIDAEELAEKIGKSRATIYRYENGDIENMPTTVLEPIAKALNITPAYLMGWIQENEWDISSKRLEDSFNALYHLLHSLGWSYEWSHEDEKYIFSNGSTSFQITAEEYTDLIAQLQDFCRKKLQKLLLQSSSLLNAAHERTDCELTAEGQEHDDEIMKDDSEWK